MPKDKFLILGANGKIGTELTKVLRKTHGQENVIATDIHLPIDGTHYLPFEKLDATDGTKMSHIVERYRITHIYHLAAILSTKGEINPLNMWDVNMKCFFNVLEVARSFKIKKVFFPSSIAVFGSNTPRINAPQDTIRTPETVYGMSKVAAENWSSYYFKKYNVDIRSLRFPSIIHKTESTGSTGDFAVEMIKSAVEGKNNECFIDAKTRTPLMYVDDAVRSTLEIMDTPASKISIRSSYNLAAFSSTPEELFEEIKKYYPQFKRTYKPDFRHDIAHSWPESIDDSAARNDWKWQPNFNLEETVNAMMAFLRKQKV